jgi:hypothetical protein
VACRVALIRLLERIKRRERERILLVDLALHILRVQANAPHARLQHRYAFIGLCIISEINDESGIERSSCTSATVVPLAANFTA